MVGGNRAIFCPHGLGWGIEIDLKGRARGCPSHRGTPAPSKSLLSMPLRGAGGTIEITFALTPPRAHRGGIGWGHRGGHGGVAGESDFSGGGEGSVGAQGQPGDLARGTKSIQKAV